MILVSGSSVTSVRNGLPSTRPTMRTDSCFETGNRGFVMLVGSENVGVARSTRLPCGAVGRSSRTTGWGIVFDPPSPVAAVESVAFAGPELLSAAVESTPHAPTTARAATRASADAPPISFLLPIDFLLRPGAYETQVWRPNLRGG